MPRPAGAFYLFPDVSAHYGKTTPAGRTEMHPELTYDGPIDREACDRMLRIIGCESNGLASAHHPGGASGLFQHLPKYWSSRSSAAGVPGADIFDPTAGAIVAAWLLYDAPGGGWAHWTCKG